MYFEFTTNLIIKGFASAETVGAQLLKAFKRIEAYNINVEDQNENILPEDDASKYYYTVTCGGVVGEVEGIDTFAEKIVDTCKRNFEGVLDYICVEEIEESAGEILLAEYSNEADKTFLSKEIYNEKGELASIELVGWYFGKPDDLANAMFNGKLKANFIGG